MADDPIRHLAERRVEARFGFLIHTVVFIAVISLLWGINLARRPDQLWAVWPTAGWGIGLLLHGLSVLLRSDNGSRIRERMIQREMERLREKSSESQRQ